MKFTLYRSNCLGVPENCTYPHKVEVTGKDSLIEAVKHDYVCAEYQGNYRSNDNFIGSDCLPVDCDNDHSDDPKNGSILQTSLQLSPVLPLRFITAAIT